MPLTPRQLASPTGTRAILKQFGIRPSKRWGQHFLVSPHALERTLDAAAVSRSDSVLEVGAGIGTLTLGLAERAGWVAAVEVDPRLVRALEATVGGHPNVRIFAGDVLTLSPPALFQGPPEATRKVVANLPYNVASAVLVRLLGAPLRLATLVVTVQREVADRLIARPGGRDYGILSVAIQYRAVPRVVARLGPGAFFPPPAVESAIVELRPRDRPAVAKEDEPAFFRIVRAGFGQRRKTLLNALTHGLGFPRDAVASACRGVGIDPGTRAETLDLEAFARLSRALVDLGLTGQRDLGDVDHGVGELNS